MECRYKLFQNLYFDCVMQKDTMQCGVASLCMICRYYGKRFSLDFLSEYCHSTVEGVSLLGITEAAKQLGFETKSCRMNLDELHKFQMPCILHWNQNHFVVLYKIGVNGDNFYIADLGKGKIKYSAEEFKIHWVSAHLGGENQGIVMFLEPTELFFEMKDTTCGERRSFRFLLGYLKQYRKYFVHVILGLGLGCILQLILPFLTQSIVDIGIHNKNINFIWLVLFGELMIVVGKTATEFVRRWLLLHISMRINISLLSDFLIKLLKLPMSFFELRLIGDIMQRMGDHNRVQAFLTGQTLTILYTSLSFVALGSVLFFYDHVIFFVFIFSSVLYGCWVALFLRRRKVIDYEYFEHQSINNNMTYQLITSMQEIKLQDCEQRWRW